MTTTHQQYLEHILKSKQLLLDHRHIEHRIAIAEHNKEMEMLSKDIQSIEKQLERVESK